MIGFCPACNQRVVYRETDADTEHKCNSGNAALDQEDVLKLNGPNAVLQGIANKAQFTNAGILGFNIDDVTVRGNRASTHSQEQRIQNIKLRGTPC